MSETNAPAETLRRAAGTLRADAERFRPGGQDERFRLAVAEYLEMATLVATLGRRLSEHPLKIARAYLGEEAAD